MLTHMELFVGLKYFIAYAPVKRYHITMKDNPEFGNCKGVLVKGCHIKMKGKAIQCNNLCLNAVGSTLYMSRLSIKRIGMKGKGIHA